MRPLKGVVVGKLLKGFAAVRPFDGVVVGRPLKWVADRHKAISGTIHKFNLEKSTAE